MNIIIPFMEELDPRPTVCETAWKAPRRAYIGFTIFDAIHIICGIVLIVLGCRSNPIDAFAIAEHSVIILLSILLIAYIAALAKPSHDHDAFHGAYTYAWLVATAGIIVPSLFSIPYIAMGEWEFSVYAAIGLEVAALVVAAIIFAIFFLVLFNYRKQKFWRRAIWLPESDHPAFHPPICLGILRGCIGGRTRFRLRRRLGADHSGRAWIHDVPE